MILISLRYFFSNKFFEGFLFKKKLTAGQVYRFFYIRCTQNYSDNLQLSIPYPLDRILILSSVFLDNSKFLDVLNLNYYRLLSHLVFQTKFLLSVNNL